MVKIKKPTGSGVCPPEIKCAQKIDEKINKHAGTRNLSDSDFDDDGNGFYDSAASDDVAEVVSHPSELTLHVHTQGARKNNNQKNILKIS